METCEPLKLDMTAYPIIIKVNIFPLPPNSKSSPPLNLPLMHDVCLITSHESGCHQCIRSFDPGAHARFSSTIVSGRPALSSSYYSPTLDIKESLSFFFSSLSWLLELFCLLQLVYVCACVLPDVVFISQGYICPNYLPPTFAVHPVIVSSVIIIERSAVLGFESGRRLGSSRSICIRFKGSLRSVVYG